MSTIPPNSPSTLRTAARVVTQGALDRFMPEPKSRLAVGFRSVVNSLSSVAGSAGGVAAGINPGYQALINQQLEVQQQMQLVSPSLKHRKIETRVAYGGDSKCSNCIGERLRVLRELTLPLGVVAILASMLVPLPPAVLDLLLVGNLVLAVVLLASALYLSDPVRLSSLPTILLLATLYRLALNVSTTRLILGSGEAGQMIETFGTIAIQGNLVVGAVIFIVITFVQFLVIAKGAERVAEVSARFTLDALPGKQMSIDADVRSGLIDIETARQKRSELQTESRFYGALDGAMKFVKGDAIAGIAITGINVVGGLIVGVGMVGLDFESAIQRYTLLTIGDGLLSQIPALLSSLAAGMVVTRVVSESSQSLANDVISQLGRMRKARLLAGGVSLLFAIVLGPSLPFLILSGVLFGTVLISAHSGREERSKAAESFEPRTLPLLQVYCPLCVSQIGTTKADLTELCHALLTEAYEDTGLILPPPVFELRKDDRMDLSFCLRGIQVKSVPFGDDKQNEDLKHELQQFLTFLLENYRHELVDDMMTRRLLDGIDREAPELVSAVVPNVLSVTQLSCLLRALVEEQVSLRNFEVILQTVAEKGEGSSERELVEETRKALGRRVVTPYTVDGSLAAWLLDPVIDLQFAQAEQETKILGAEELNGFLDNAHALIDEAGGERRVVVLSTAKARRYISEICLVHKLPITVLAHEEVPPEVTIYQEGTLALSDEEAEKAVGRLVAA